MNRKWIICIVVLLAILAAFCICIVTDPEFREYSDVYHRIDQAAGYNQTIRDNMESLFDELNHEMSVLPIPERGDIAIGVAKQFDYLSVDEQRELAIWIGDAVALQNEDLQSMLNMIKTVSEQTGLEPAFVLLQAEYAGIKSGNNITDVLFASLWMMYGSENAICWNKSLDYIVAGNEVKGLNAAETAYIMLSHHLSKEMQQ